MPCYSLLDGWFAKQRNDSGRRSIVFNLRDALVDRPIKLPCGQCIGCRLEYARQWSIRIMHEASLHDENSFITLTYAPEFLPKSGSLQKRDFQLFMKRYRKKFGNGIRFFHCGEYGDQLGRPHYHAAIFGHEFKDKRFHKKTSSGETYYTSETLNKLWGKGYCIIGELEFESAAYIARYITKKVNGDLKEAHYERIDSETGEVYSLCPEYVTMSRKPGIGCLWIEKYFDEVYNNDEVIIRGGVACKPPKYYDEFLRLTDEKRYNKVKSMRRVRAASREEQNSDRRLLDRFEVKKAQFSQLVRGFENGK